MGAQLAANGDKAPQKRAMLRAISTPSKTPTDPLDELWFRKPIRAHIREFGALLGAILLIIGCVKAYKGNLGLAVPLSIVGVIIYFIGLKFPKALRPIWRSWMTLAEALGTVMTALILGIGWVILVIPFGIALKLLKIRVMNTTFREDIPSYWDERDEKSNDFKQLTRQF